MSRIVAALVLTFVAAYLQQSRVGLPALQLSHNAVYHSLQSLALVPIFAAMLQILGGPGPRAALPSEHEGPPGFSGGPLEDRRQGGYRK